MLMTSSIHVLRGVHVPHAAVFKHSGQQKIPVPVYFICSGEQPSNGSTTYINELPDGGELCSNLFYLGRSGVKSIAGLEVGYLSGAYDAQEYDSDPSKSLWRSTQYERHYTQTDLGKVVKGSTDVGLDLLLTAEWGEGFGKLIPAGDPQPKLKAKLESPAVARLATAVATSESPFAFASMFRPPSILALMYFTLACDFLVFA